MADYGVIPTPTVRKIDVHDDDVVLVCASDGVWDVMNPTDCVEHVMMSRERGRSPTMAAKALVMDAVAKSLELDGDADNTTAVVIYLR